MISKVNFRQRFAPYYLKYCFMKKLVYYPNMWQTYPFSIDLYIHSEKEAAKKETDKKERKSKFKLALGW